MKKIFVFALCFAAVGAMSAQKKVLDQVMKKLGTKEATELLKQAAQDPETANTARYYYAAGKNEFKAGDEIIKPRLLNPNAEVDELAAAKRFLAGYKYFMEAIPLAGKPDEKGKQDTKALDDMASILVGHLNDFYSAGVTGFNTKNYYPEAYEGFMIFGDLPTENYIGKYKKNLAVPDSVRGVSYFNAGRAAYAGKAIDQSANAFRKAIECGHGKDAYIFEIACWQYISKEDSLREVEAQNKIAEVAQMGYEKLGVQDPVFLQNLVNIYIHQGKVEPAIELVNKELVANPEMSQLYGLLGFIYDRMDKPEESEAAYRKGASLPNADVETLKNAGKKIFRNGTERWDKIEGDTDAANKERAIVKKDYFEASKIILERAKKLAPQDTSIDYILDNINYALESYF